MTDREAKDTGVRYSKFGQAEEKGGANPSLFSHRGGENYLPDSHNIWKQIRRRLWNLRASLLAMAAVSIVFIPIMASGVYPKWQVIYSIWVAMLLFVMLIGKVFTEAYLAFMVTIALFVVPGVADVRTVTRGFGNSLLAAIGLLYVIANAVRTSTAMSYVARHVLGKPATVRWALARLLPPVMLMSGFMSNTAIISIMGPVVQHWAKECRLPARPLLLPLNFATIFGGMLSVIGTSANLTAQTYASQDRNKAFHDFDFFEIGYVGLPCCILAYAYLVIMGPIILRETEDKVENGERRVASESRAASMRGRLQSVNRFTAAVMIRKLNSSERTAESEGFCDFENICLIEVRRAKEVRLGSVSSSSYSSFGEHKSSAHTTIRKNPSRTLPLQIGDILVFEGQCEDIAASLFQNSNLVPVGSRQAAKLESSHKKRRLVKAVLGIGTSLEGESVFSIRFRQTFDAVVLAVHRKYSKLTEDVRDIQLQAGDALLMEVSEAFMQNHLQNPAFISITALDGDLISVLPSARPADAVVAALTMLMIVVTVATKVVRLPTACLLGVFIFLFTRIISEKDVLSSISGRTLVIIGLGFGLANVLVETGTSQILADGLAQMGSFYTVLLAVFFLTATVANVISPPATVSLLFPVVFSIQTTNINYHVEKALGVLMIAASCSVVSPYSYQTNIIIMEIGGYHAKDFVMLGLPLVLLTGLLTCTLAMWVVWGDGKDSYLS